MLQIKNISKRYKTGELVQVALDDVSLNLRDNEFVAVLGPSGSGKTTFLNIIGGLDRYDSGDLIINNISTKKYKDRDWDSYRNHTIGFVFQSYNLISHQTILSNVELALTISGVSRAERRRRAQEALDKVGLGEQGHKKPNQLSGGQMQRVAIARALVNDPDILLADEPTGALDTGTSVQVMDLLKEVAKDRLVVMVTHNSELADKYATRIVNLLDGKIVGDSNPFEIDSENMEPPQHKNMGKSRMNFATSLALSFSNLRTKKGRTILTAFAGSIGIIGIALILALSNGVNTYITDLQKDTMTSYPITIEKEAADVSGMFEAGGANSNKKSDHKLNAVFSNSDGMAVITKNNMKKFKKYLDNKDSKINNYVGKNGIVYSYDTKFDVYTYDSKKNLINTNGDSAQSNMSTMLTGSTGKANNFTEMLSSKTKMVSSAVTDNYKLVSGKWPTKSNEVVLVVDKNNEVSMTTLYNLGLITAKEYDKYSKKISDGKNVKSKSWSYKTVMGKTFYLLPASDYYIESEYGGTYNSVAANSNDVENLVKDKAIKLKVSAIVRAKNSDSTSATIGTAIGYTRALTNRIIKIANNSAVVKAQKKDKKTDVLTGFTFKAENSSSLTSTSYSDNLSTFGAVSSNDPSSISIYADSFKDKDSISDCIDDYNNSVSKDKDKISYTDYVALLMSSVTKMVNIITYVLIAFVALSLVVSSIMIGIITYISVLERTKEIGILRAIGASKRNISLVFNSETFIIGLCSGVIGIGIALLLMIPGNALIHSLTDSTSINAILPVTNALILILLSVVLTSIGGLIPAKKAARKDPVTALRTE